MLKKMLTILTVFGAIFLINITPVISVTSTITKNPTPIDHDITVLKEKIATKVAELQQKNKTILSGTVVSVQKNLLVLETRDGKTNQITVDELVTKVKTIAGNSFKVTDFNALKKGTYIIVIGTLIEDNLTSNTIYITKQYMVLTGRVVDVNKEEFTLDVVTTDKETYTVDIESNTKQQLYDVSANKLVKSGFNKIKIGDSIHFSFVKIADIKNNRVSAIRSLVIPAEFFNEK